MSRSLRGWLLGSIAIAFLYLLVHVWEPLRLNVGDPSSDADALTSIQLARSDGWLASVTGVHDLAPLSADSYRDLREPPLPEILYGTVGKLTGLGDIAAFRMLALMISALGVWLLFSYVRRLYSDRVALIATALWTTSMLWMTYADGLQHAPVMQGAAFLALWGLVRAIETRHRRHYVAAIAGSFACLFSSYDFYLFLPAAVLFTIARKAGNPFQRGNRHFVVLCAAGCALGIIATGLCAYAAVGWHELIATALRPRGSAPVLAVLTRRITLVLTPFVWIPVVFHALRAIRAPSLAIALKETWIGSLLAALVFLFLFPQLAASQMLAAQVVLPFYAIGSAVILERLLDGSVLLRRLAIAWLAAAPLWSFYFLAMHPRSVLDRQDVAKTNAYLATHDHNDFVMSNLGSDGPIAAAFGRHRWAVLDAGDPSRAPREMMRIFERTGTTSIHEIIFTGPDSRFLDRSLWPIAVPHGQWAIAAAPHMHRAKANSMIAEYDSRVTKNLKAVHAKKVLQLDNYAIYRVDRETTLALLGKDVVPTAHVDFGSINAMRNELLDWRPPSLLRDGTSASSVWGMEYCPRKPCQTILTPGGLRVKNEAKQQIGQVMIRVDRACDLRLTFTFADASFVRFAINGFSTGPMIGRALAFTVPAGNLTADVNVVDVVSLFPSVAAHPLQVTALDLAPACAGR